jgi:hypothetical protein
MLPLDFAVFLLSMVSFWANSILDGSVTNFLFLVFAWQIYVF